MDKYYCGIDPGLKGGVLILKDQEIVFKSVMPVTASKEVDSRELGKILHKYKKLGSVHVVFEKFGGFFGYAKKAAVSLGTQCGAIQATCELVGVPFTRYMPTQWAKVMFEGQTVIYKKGKDKSKKDTKKMALAVAKRLYPKETFLATSRSSVPHDGLCDALMLAEFGRRKNL